MKTVFALFLITVGPSSSVYQVYHTTKGDLKTCIELREHFAQQFKRYIRINECIQVAK